MTETTIAELEAMLNDPTPHEIQIKPDGSIHAVKKPTIHPIEVLAGDHLGRDTKDFAIEFAGYLANAAEQYQDAVQAYLRGDDGADELMGERWRKLDSAVYEFRKRAERTKT